MKKIWIASLIGGFVLWGCQPKPNANDLFKSLVVETYLEPTANFKAHSKYYFRLDTLPYLLNGDTSAIFVSTPHSLDFVDVVTYKLSDTLTSGGFTKVFKKAQADMEVRVYISEDYSISQSYYYYPYGYGYGGGYYPSVSVSDLADLYLEIWDLTGGAAKPMWQCRIGDLLSSPDYENFTYKAMDQAFKQSSYIKK